MSADYYYYLDFWHNFCVNVFFQQQQKVNNYCDLISLFTTMRRGPEVCSFYFIFLCLEENCV